MSRGPGRIERAIEAAFIDNPSETFSTDELCLLCYPGINRPEKRHRVSVIRAADNVARRLHWLGKSASRPGGEIIYSNLLDVRSYRLGMLRRDFINNCRHLLELERLIDDPNARGSEWVKCQPGGVWHRHVEINKATILGNEVEAERLSAELKRLVLARAI